MKILVTGGAGFIGSHTVVELIQEGHKPVIVDDLRNSKSFIIDNIKKLVTTDFPYYAIDFGNKEKLVEVFQKERPEGIIHFAADKSVNESVNNPLKYYNNNISNLITLLSVVKDQNIKSFIFSSSCTVYGLADSFPVNENSICKTASSPYGYTKQVGERILNDFFKTLPNTSLTNLRYFNPIGAHPSSLIGELPLGVPSNLVPFITQTAIGKRDYLTVYGNDYKTNDGTCIRDYIHVVDLAQAHVLSLNHSLNNNENIVLNVGTGKGSSVIEVVNTFEKVCDVKLNYRFGSRREGDLPIMYADNSLISSQLGWKPKFSLADSLKDAWNWEKKLTSFL